MSEVKRAYDLMRGYVQREWDRISQVEWAEAAKELMEADPANRADAPVVKPEIAPDKPSAPQPSVPERLTIEEQARKILGVGPDASFAEIRKRFEKLNTSSEALSAEPGTADALLAEKLRSRVQWAYQVLVAKTDETERRFGSLEIE